MTKINTFNPRNRGLGRGLDALFENSEASENNTPVTAPIEPGAVLSSENTAPVDTPPLSEKPRVLNISQIIPGANQPRKSFDAEKIEELANSIKKIGIIQPLLVRPTNEGLYEIIAGERRWRAAQKAQLHEVPVIIRKIKDTEVLQIGLIENLQREDLDPVEEAFGYQNLMGDFGHSQQQVADLVGKSRPHVANMLRLLNLPEKILDMLRSGDLSTGHARALIGRDNAVALAEKVIKENLSVRAVEALSDILSAEKSGSTKSPQVINIKDADTYALEKELGEKLGLSFKISPSSKPGEGDVKIRFKSMDQLNYLVDILRKA